MEETREKGSSEIGPAKRGRSIPSSIGRLGFAVRVLERLEDVDYIYGPISESCTISYLVFPISSYLKRTSLSLTQMISLRTILQLPFFAAANINPFGPPKIQWGACTETAINSALPIECGNLGVPLDYTEPTSNASLTLELLRVSAAIQPSKGSILFNFGGPGSTGRGALALLAPALIP